MVSTARVPGHEQESIVLAVLSIAAADPVEVRAAFVGAAVAAAS